MKSILLSIKPKWVAKILNGEKAIEIRKQFPKDYVGWIYIYCTKTKPLVYYVDDEIGCVEKTNGEFAFRTSKNPDECNGKVVARFWCDKVEEMYTDENGMSYYTDTIKKDYMVSKLACLDDSDIENYLSGKIGYAIHISKLEVFDKPRELSDFHKIVNIKKCDTRYCDDYYTCNKCIRSKLTNAPQNYCYVEGEEK